jgi:hypothetical protein
MQNRPSCNRKGDAATGTEVKILSSIRPKAPGLFIIKGRIALLKGV